MQIKTYDDVELISARALTTYQISLEKVAIANIEKARSKSRAKWDAKLKPFAHKPSQPYSDWMDSGDRSKQRKLEDKRSEADVPFDDRIAEHESRIWHLERGPGGKNSRKDGGTYVLDPRSKKEKVILEGCPLTPEYELAPANLPEGTEWLEVAPQWFLFRGQLHYTDDRRLTGEDVVALVTEKENRRRLKLEKAHTVKAMVENGGQAETGASRKSIPTAVRHEVWKRDGGRCVDCGDQKNLEFDHIIPFSMGGANTARNLQLLCESCNRSKGATLG